MCVRNSGISKRIREKSLNDTIRINVWERERRQQRKKIKISGTKNTTIIKLETKTVQLDY